MPDVELDGAAAIYLYPEAETIYGNLSLTTWESDESQMAYVSFWAEAIMTPDVPVVEPPSDVVHVKRVSHVYPDPNPLNYYGRPVDWVPVSEVNEDWGRLRVLFDNVDVSYFRGVPVQVKSWAEQEPFGWARAEIAFPQISPMEHLPLWLENWASVEIKLVRPDNTQEDLFVGLFADEEDSLDESGSGLVVQVIGLLFQADLYLMPPSITPRDSADIGNIIVQEMSPNIRPNVRYGSFYGGIFTNKFVRSGGSWDPLLTGYVQGLLEQTTFVENGAAGQWTIKMIGRRPDITKKDRTTIHWTMRCGQPGITHQLSRDLSMMATTVYGEGVNEEHCKWRNTRYPNLRTDPAPVYPGVLMGPGSDTQWNTWWKTELYVNGYVSLDKDDSYYDPSEEQTVRNFQATAGIQVDGIVGPQTWAAVYQPGSNSGNLAGAYFAPIFTEPYVEKWAYNASGGIIGENQYWTPGLVKVEKYENFGAPISKDEAVRSVVNEMDREGGVDVHQAGFMGTITLKADPNEGSRFEIRAGDNFLLQNHRAGDTLLHIAQVDVNWEDQSVELTVDERARDYATIGSILVRDRENIDPARRKRMQYRNSKRIEDRRAEWDCENGAGNIPYHGTYAGLWNVLRIPAGSLGTIVRTEFTTDADTRFSCAVFDRLTTHQTLTSHGSPLDEGYWDSFPEDTGLIVAWGGSGQMGGYYPGAESDEAPVLTGRLVDDASWYYETTYPPWLWIAIWTEATTYIQGRLFPGVND